MDAKTRTRLGPVGKAGAHAHPRKVESHPADLMEQVAVLVRVCLNMGKQRAVYPWKRDPGGR